MTLQRLPAAELLHCEQMGGESPPRELKHGRFFEILAAAIQAKSPARIPQNASFLQPSITSNH
eukprot:2666717-Rhodomonas_salina.1